MYKNKGGRVLYIGKAVNIQSRVNSYITNYSKLDPKIKVLIDQVTDVEFITTDNDLEALILETNLIKKYKPKYNRMMKDDKNYSWLVITKGEDFPRIELIREKKFKKHDYFGPYANQHPIKRTLKQLRKIFPYRSCKRKIFLYKDKKGKKRFYSSNKKPCLYYHLNLCDAPCANFISKKLYRDNINNIKRFFRSRKFEIIEDLKKQMNEFAEDQKFEKAAEIRDKLEDLAYIAQRIQIRKDMDEIILEIHKKEISITAIERLVTKLKISNLKYVKQFRIECYDISNIAGKSATGSMIVFIDGKPDKSSYRKFRIKTKDTPDDYEMMREVLDRRFKIKGRKGKDKSFRNLPNLVIIDGGKGQLSSALKVLQEYDLKVQTIGLAKKDEGIFKFEDNKFKKIKLRKGSPEFFLIQRIRDEAHRFAIKYHRKLRSKRLVSSKLDGVPGVGEIVRKRLLRAFGSTDNITKASFEELQSVVKNRRTVGNIKKLV